MAFLLALSSFPPQHSVVHAVWGKQWLSSQFPPWNPEGAEQHCNLSGS